LLIVEIVLPGANQPSPGKLMDLIMLVNNPRRRERTLKEYRDLLAMAGFRRARVVPTASPGEGCRGNSGSSGYGDGLAQDR